MDNEVKRRKKKGERSDGRVQVTLTIGHNDDGSPCKKSFYGKTRAEAMRKRDEYKAKMGAGLLDKKVTVADWIDTCLRLYRTKVNAAYIRNDSVPYNRLKRAIGRMQLANVREVDLQNALNEVAEMSQSTIDAYYQAIFRIFDKARKNKLIPDNPAEGLDIPNGTRGTHRAFDRWESDCILANWSKHRCGIWAMLMMLCGLRRGEMMGLNWRNVDMEKRQLTVCEVSVIATNQPVIEQRAKTISSIRVLPICAPLWEALNRTPESERTGLVCTAVKGKPITSSAFKRG